MARTTTEMFAGDVFGIASAYVNLRGSRPDSPMHSDPAPFAQFSASSFALVIGDLTQV